MFATIPSVINALPIEGGVPAGAFPVTELLVSPFAAWLILLGALVLTGAVLLALATPPVPRRRTRPQSRRARPAAPLPQHA